MPDSGWAGTAAVSASTPEPLDLPAGSTQYDGRMRVAVVGATGAVGRTIVSILEERRFPLDDLVLLASPRSEGTRLPFRGRDLTVRAVHDRWFDGVDVALSSCGSAVARQMLPPAARAGTVSVDNSSAFRMDPDVPLVIPELNPEALSSHHGIVANANCTAITALMALGPLHKAFGLRFLVTSSYQSVSGAGMKGVRELDEQIEKLHGDVEGLARPDLPALPAAETIGRTNAFNVLPHAGVGWTIWAGSRPPGPRAPARRSAAGTSPCERSTTGGSMGAPWRFRRAGAPWPAKCCRLPLAPAP